MPSNATNPEPAYSSPPQPEISAVDRQLVRLVAALLLFQGLGLLAIAYWLLTTTSWPSEIDSLEEVLALSYVEIFLFAFLTGALGLLVGLTSIGLFLVRPIAWLFALLLQILLLFLVLNEYFFPDELWQPSAILYLIMASCIVLVFYLNLNDVRQSIQQQASKRRANHAESAR